MDAKGYDWGGFLVSDPLNEQPPLSPSAFGKQLLAVDDASGALTLLGISALAIPDPTGQGGNFLTTDGVNLSWSPAAGGGGTWGSITGSLSSQGDLNTALGGKQPLDSDLTSWAGITRATGFDAFVATPTSSNLRAVLTDENGTGAALFNNATSPSFKDTFAVSHSGAQFYIDLTSLTNDAIQFDLYGVGGQQAFQVTGRGQVLLADGDAVGGHYLLLNPPAVTANRALSWPDNSGTLAIASNSSGQLNFSALQNIPHIGTYTYFIRLIAGTPTAFDASGIQVSSNADTGALINALMPTLSVNPTGAVFVFDRGAFPFASAITHNTPTIKDDLGNVTQLAPIVLRGAGSNVAADSTEPLKQLNTIFYPTSSFSPTGGYLVNVNASATGSRAVRSFVMEGIANVCTTNGAATNQSDSPPYGVTVSKCAGISIINPGAGYIRNVAVGSPLGNGISITTTDTGSGVGSAFRVFDSFVNAVQGSGHYAFIVTLDDCELSHSFAYFTSAGSTDFKIGSGASQPVRLTGCDSNANNGGTVLELAGSASVNGLTAHGDGVWPAIWIKKTGTGNVSITGSVFQNARPSGNGGTAIYQLSGSSGGSVMISGCSFSGLDSGSTLVKQTSNADPTESLYFGPNDIQVTSDPVIYTSGGFTQYAAGQLRYGPFNSNSTPLFGLTRTNGNLIANYQSTGSGNAQLVFDSDRNTNLTFRHSGVDKWYVGNDYTNDRYRWSDGTNEVASLFQGGGLSLNNSGYNPGLGNLSLGGLTASQFVETDANKKLVSFAPGTGVRTFLATPTSANLRAALTDENGTGAALFNGAASPTFTGLLSTDSISAGPTTVGLLTADSVVTGDVTLGTGGVLSDDGAGFFRWKSVTGSYQWGIDDSILSASRTYTLPDKAGTFAIGNTSGQATDGTSALLVKPAVAVVAVTNLTLSGEQTIDGITTSGSLVLCTAQTTGANNGPWVSASGAWTRPTWYANGSTTQAPQFLTTFARLGTTYSGSTWRMTTAGVTIGTTATTWAHTPISLESTNVTNTLGVANGGTGITSFGVGVATALGINVGSAGAFVTNGGALGTPTSGTLTNCSFPTLNQNTTGSAASLSVSGQTGLFTVTGLTSTNRAKTVRDAADTILELGGSYTPTGAWTSLPLTTPKVTTAIQDANANSMLAFTATASAVDGFTFTNAATANPATVTMAATGSDSNIKLALTPKGAAGVVVNEQVGGSGLTVTGATQTTSQPVINATQTWNASGVTFTGLKLNITNTASATSSLLADFQIAGSSFAQIDKSNRIGAGSFSSEGYKVYWPGGGAGGAVNGITAVSNQLKGSWVWNYLMLGSAQIGFAADSSTAGLSSSADAGISRNGAGIVEVNTGTLGQWGALKAGVRDSGTTTVTNGLTVGHQSTGTPAAGLGSAVLFNIDSSTTADQNAVQLSALWTTATHASRTADFVVKNVNSAAALAETFRVTAAGNVSQVGKTTTYNNIATVSNGIPSEVATIDSTGLTANVAASTLYSVPASGAGLYRVSAYLVTTTAASVSSTMPNAQVVYTDSDSNTSVTLDVSPILGAAGLGQSGLLTANAVGTVFSGTVVIYAKLSTTIQYQTVNYASTAGGMAYALRMKLEAL